MNIRTALRHRAEVRRSTTTNVNGMPTTTWGTVATNVPILLDTKAHEVIPNTMATVAQVNEARKFGLAFVSTQADIRPADRLNIKVPGRPVQTFEVQPTPSFVHTPTGVSHRELRVKEI